MIVKGYRGRLTIEKAEELALKGVYVVDARCVGGMDHIIYAYNKSKEMFVNGKNIANKFHIELMLVLTGRRQITKALELAGVKSKTTLVAISEEEFDISLERDDSVIDCDLSKLEYLGINYLVEGKECDAFFEKSAMLYMER